MIFDNNIFAPGTEPSTVDHESKALPLRERVVALRTGPEALAQTRATISRVRNTVPFVRPVARQGQAFIRRARSSSAGSKQRRPHHGLPSYSPTTTCEQLRPSVLHRAFEPPFAASISS